MEGLEPPRREALDPKSSVATNYTTSATGTQSYYFFTITTNLPVEFIEA